MVGGSNGLRNLHPNAQDECLRLAVQSRPQHDLLPLHVTPLAKRQLSSRQTDGEVPARWNRPRLPGGRNPPPVF